VSATAGPGAAGGAAGPDVSVITPSAGRAACVLRKFEALARQSVGPGRIEVVLVDNLCPERVGDLVAARPWPFTLRVLRADERLSAAAARRWAAAEAVGPWLWWSDDDVVPDDDALERHLARQVGDPCVSVGAIRFVTPAGVRRWRPRRGDAVHVTGVNTLLPRAALARVDGDVIDLPRRYGGEDTVIGLALEAAGVPIVAAPDAWVAHHGAAPADGGDLAKGYDAGYNAAVIAGRYPRAAWPLGVHPLQLAAKRALLGPLGSGGATSGGPRGRLHFERAYLDGALAGRRHTPGGPAARPPEAHP